MENAIKDLNCILDVFKKYGVHVYVSYGAALGATRNKKLIEWDDDIDIDVIDKVDYKTRKAIGWELHDLGFTPQPISVNVFGRMEPLEYGYNGDEQSGIIACERNFKFSIFFYKEEGDIFVCIPRMSAMPLISIPTRFFHKPSTITLHGNKYTSPGPIKEYLAYVYGHDWKTPIKDLHAPNCITGKTKHE